jgi:ATP phosphoribosyltransferase
MLSKGAIEAAGKAGLMLNVRRGDLDEVLEALPALKSVPPFPASVIPNGWR